MLQYLSALYMYVDVVTWDFTQASSANCNCSLGFKFALFVVNFICDICGNRMIVNSNGRSTNVIDGVSFFISGLGYNQITNLESRNLQGLITLNKL